MTKLYLMTTEVIKSGGFEKLYNTLSDYRKNKIDKMKLQNGKMLSLTAGILTDSVLGLYGLAEKDMIYGEAEGGKPYFVNHPEIKLNISHSESTVICAVSKEQTGCDIQKIGEIREKILKKYFSDKEQKYVLSADSPSERNSRFFEIWTLKESFLKCTGEGLGGLLSCGLEIESGKIRLTSKRSGEKSYFFRQYEYPNYKIAVCSEENEFSDEIIIFRC